MPNFVHIHSKLVFFWGPGPAWTNSTQGIQEVICKWQQAGKLTNTK